MNDFTQFVTDFLAAQSLHLLILFVVVLAVTLLLRRKTAHLRYLLWLLVVAKCIVPPLHTIPLAVLPERIDDFRWTMDENRRVGHAHQSVDNPAQAWTPNNAATHTDSASGVRSSGFSLPENEHAQAWTPNLVGMAHPTGESRLEAGVTILSALWLGGVGVYFLVMVVKGVRFGRYLRRHRAALPNANPVRVYQLSRPGQPFVWGLWRGAIYLPSNFAGRKKAGDRGQRSDFFAERGSND